MRICDLVVVIRILFSLQSLFLWLSQNQLDVTYYKMTPYVDSLSKQVILDMQKILPVSDCSDFFIKVESSPNLRSEGRTIPEESAKVKGNDRTSDIRTGGYPDSEGI